MYSLFRLASIFRTLDAYIYQSGYSYCLHLKFNTARLGESELKKKKVCDFQNMDHEYDESLDMDEDDDEWLNFDDGEYYDDPNRFITRFDFPEFHGDSSDTDVFRDWVEEVDKVFDEKDVIEDPLKVTLAVSCFQSSALAWWNNLQLLRAQKGLPEIATWSDLIREMYRQYVPLPVYKIYRKKRLIDD